MLIKMKNISDNSCRGSRNTFYVQYNFSENLAGYEIMLENVVDPDRSQMAIKYDACALRAG